MWANYLFFIVTLIFSLEFIQITQTRTRDYDWDLLIFTQQWPPTVCKIWKDNPSHMCNLPKNEDSWTVHGIWPTSLEGEDPSFCNRSWIFNPELIKPIEKDLMTYWTNIEAGMSFYSFWAHEWSKHGTCAAILEPFNSELKYFQTGLKWLEDYSMNSILEEFDIVPSNDKEYNITDINNAVKTKLGVNPMLECRNKSHEQFLIEIRVCTTKNLKLTNCDGVKLDTVKDNYVLGNCVVTKGVKYPVNEYASSRLIIQLYKLNNWLQWMTL